MAIAVLLILAALWAAVLVPPVLRSRSEGRRGSAVGDLNFRLGKPSALTPALNRPGPGRSTGPYRPGAFPARGAGPIPSRVNGSARPAGAITPAQKRRRDVLLILLGGAALSLLVALFTGSMIVWGLHLVVDLALGGFVFLLVQLKQRSPAHPLPTALPNERPRQVRHARHLESAHPLAVRRSP